MTHILQINAINDLQQRLSSAKTVLLLSHVGPDGDAISSLLAFRELCSTFTSIDTIDVVPMGKVPDVYNFLPGIHHFKSLEDNSLLETYDLACSLDCGSKDRLAKLEPLFDKAQYRVNIDHHNTNTNFGDTNIVDEIASSTAEVVFEIFDHLHIPISLEAAIPLYTGILTDTGGFKFSNTTPKALRRAATLVELGVKPQKIYEACYDSQPLEMVKVHAISVNKLKSSDDKKIVWTDVRRSDLEAANADDDHLDGIIDTIRKINTAEIAIIFKETRDGHIKVSFRGKHHDISKIAKSFGGGGHKLAAGCTIENVTIEEAQKIILPKVVELLATG